MNKKQLKHEDLRVLVVDDHMMMRNMIAQNLRSLDVKQIESASNGEDAIKEIAAANEIGRPYHIVFLDWHMPGMEGLDVLKQCRQIKAFDKHAFVMLTAEQEQKSILLAIENGATSYLIKPVARDVLEKNLKKVVRWLENNEVNVETKSEPASAKDKGDSEFPDALREQLKPVVAKGMKNIFSELFQVQIIPEQQRKAAEQNAMVCVGRLHQKNVTLALRFFFDQELLKPLLMQLYSAKYLEEQGVYEDAACEIVNILCAQVKAFLNSHGYELHLDLPRMGGQEEKLGGAESILNVYFSVNPDQCFLVDLTVNDGR